MQETDIVRGELRVLGQLHGGVALNTIVTYYIDPQNWTMKQFVSQQELDQFVKTEMLRVVTKE